MPSFTPKQKKALLIAVLLLMFAELKMLTLFWLSQQQPASEAVSCRVAQGCVLPNGSRVQFRAALKQPFTVEVSGVAADVRQVSVSFSMRDMDMGFNRFDLQPQADGRWLADNVRLPLCTAQRHDYLADIRIGNDSFQVAFEAY